MPEGQRAAIIVDDADVQDYELIDVGGGARLERFGDRVVDRPSPAALGDRREPARWRDADLRFDRDRGWSGPAAGAGAWAVSIAELALELRATDAGQVGLFPEHAAMLPWLARQGVGRALNLFAYTGLTTLALARAGWEITHVDAARSTVGWARRNGELSGLDDRPIRWIVDDAAGFVAREIRRERRYDGIVLDPPTYGHGPDGRPWRLEADVSDLLISCRALLEPDGFILLTAHTPGFDADRLTAAIAEDLGRPPHDIEGGELVLGTVDGRHLDLGAFARVARGAS
jgi:23S rRNA (cytosine1962-C5)-methyltransferase